MAGRGWKLYGAALLFVLAACEREEVRVYEAPADPPPAQADPGAPQRSAASLPPAAVSAGGVMRWSLPDGWRELDEPRPMRIATLEAGEGEGSLQFAVSAFPGTTGGILANVNRWRDQFGLYPLTEPELARHVRPFEGRSEDSARGWTVRISSEADPSAGTASRGMLGAIIEGDPERTWFVRGDGPPALLDRHEEGFMVLVESFRFVSAEAEADPAGRGDESGAERK